MITRQEFEQWVDAYSENLFLWCRARISSDEVVEDLVQDTFLAAFQALHTFQQKSSPLTWLHSILQRKVADYYRAFYREQKELGVKNSMEESSPLFDQSGKWADTSHWSGWENSNFVEEEEDFLLTLELCLSNLPEKWRNAMALRYFDGLKSETICQEMEITPTTYWQWMHRARLLLKTCIEKNI
jgi:RNA polymerase sigma factor (sigma-70 family)